MRGRFSLRSGSGAGSLGEAVAERDLRLRRFGVAVAVLLLASMAFSRAPHALFSSTVS